MIRPQAEVEHEGFFLVHANQETFDCCDGYVIPYETLTSEEIAKIESGTHNEDFSDLPYIAVEEMIEMLKHDGAWHELVMEARKRSR